MIDNAKFLEELVNGGIIRVQSLGGSVGLAKMAWEEMAVYMNGRRIYTEPLRYEYWPKVMGCGIYCPDWVYIREPVGNYQTKALRVVLRLRRRSILKKSIS